MTGTGGEAALAERCVRTMLERDEFSRWLGITPIDIRPRGCVISMTVRPEMVNGFGVAHGGIAYSLADSALAFAANTHGKVTVALENSISYPSPVRAGDKLTATARELTAKERVAFYEVTITNQDGTIVSLFRGTVYRTKTDLIQQQS